MAPRGRHRALVLTAGILALFLGAAPARAQDVVPAPAVLSPNVLTAAPEQLVPPTGEETADPAPVASQRWLAEVPSAVGASARQGASLIWEDYRHYYSWENLGIMGLEVALAAPLANTAADQHFHTWYQREVRSRDTDRVALVAKQFGEWTYLVPTYLGAFSVGWLTEETLPGSVLEEWGSRSLRAMIVGTLPLGAMQVGLGSGRPDTGTSSWRPFHDSHGASGHAFVGSVPFLTAASMTDSLWVQCPLVMVSSVTAWSRINDGAHFVSQAALGWCLGCAAVVSVNATTRGEQAIRILPAGPNGEPGASVEIRY